MTELFDRFWAFATADRPPLSGPITSEQARVGLDRVEAWSRWARLALEGDDAQHVRLLITQLNAVLANVDPFDGDKDLVETRNALITYALDAARAYKSDDAEWVEKRLATRLLERTQQVSPVLAGRVEEQLATVQGAIAAVRAGHERKAIAILSKVLTGKKRAAEPKELADTHKKTLERRRRRRTPTEK